MRKITFLLMILAIVAFTFSACKTDGGGTSGDDVVVFDWGNTGSALLVLNNGKDNNTTDQYQGASLPFSGATGPATTGSLGGRYTQATIWVKLYNNVEGTTANASAHGTEGIAMAIFSSGENWNGSDDVICNLTNCTSADLAENSVEGNVWDSSKGYKPFGMTSKRTHVAIQVKAVNVSGGDDQPVSPVKSARVLKIKFER